MSTTAFVFPGQGSQKAGMAADFHECFAEAREAFEEASSAISVDLREICFGDDARLALTEFQQPAILTVEVAMTRCLAAHFGVTADYFGGHSLGEYAALVAAGVMELGEATRLVAERGRLMQAAVAPGVGAMTAVMAKQDVDAVALAEALLGIEVDIANLNAANQVVLSGRADAMEEAVATLKGDSRFERCRFMALRVSAPFHSRLMKSVEDDFALTLAASCGQWDCAPAVRVTSNSAGDFHSGNGAAVAGALARQISAPVRWVDNMRCLLARAETVVEVGPGRPLRGFFAPLGVTITCVTNLDSARALEQGPG